LNKKLIDDVRLEDEDERGPPILYPNQQIRRMFRLADLDEQDVFYDLGSGWGQTLIVALTEFKVKKAIGIEKDKERHSVCMKRLKEWDEIDSTIPLRGKSVLGNMDDLFSGRLPGANLNEATVVFYGLSTYAILKTELSSRMSRGARLIYNWPFPEVMPVEVDYPFFMSRTPFREPPSELEWLASVVRKSESSEQKGQKPSIDELKEEFAHDCNIADYDDARAYMRRLNKAVNKESQMTKVGRRTDGSEMTAS
jgi:hypothetical protein